MFSNASSSSISSPRCVSFSATFACSCSAAMRVDHLAIRRDDRLGLRSARARLRRAASCSRRAPARSAGAGRRRTRRASRRRRSAPAPSRMPCRRTSPWTRRLSAAARIPLRSVALTAPFSCATAAIRALRRPGSASSVRWPFSSSIQASAPGIARRATRRARPGRSGRRLRGGSASAARCLPTSKPHGATNARSSSIQPSAPARSPWRDLCVQPRGERPGERGTVGVAEQRLERSCRSPATLSASIWTRSRSSRGREAPPRPRARGRTPRRSPRPCRRASRALRRPTARRRPATRRR